MVILRDALLSEPEARTLRSRLGQSQVNQPPKTAAASDLLYRLTQGPLKHWKSTPERCAAAEFGWIEESISRQIPDFFALNERGQLPWGAISALGDGLMPVKGESWAPLQLATLQMSPQQVGLSFASDCHEIGPRYLNAIGETLHANGLRVERARSGRYYLVANRNVELVAAHPRCLLNAHLPDYPVLGADAAWWRRLSNEIQMTWSQLTPEDGDPLANGATMVWAWGWGALPAAGSKSPPLTPANGVDPEMESGTEPWIAGLQALLGSIGLCPRIETRTIVLDPSLHPIDAWTTQWCETLADLADLSKKEIDTLLLVDEWESLVITPYRSTHLAHRLRGLLGQRLASLSAWPSRLVIPNNTSVQDA